MKYYILNASFVENHPTGAELQKEIDAHLEYLESFFKNGTILMSGPKVGIGGGIVVVKSDDIQKFCNDDPFVKSGIQKYQITEFSLHDCQDSLKTWFNE